MSTMIKAVAGMGARRAALIDRSFDDSPLKPDEVTGKTVVTVISPGTELFGMFDNDAHEPRFGGYASVFEVDSVGEAVTDLKPGQLVFHPGPHMARQRAFRAMVAPLPERLKPEHAVFTRLAGVSWTTLITTRARPADTVLVMGLGIVGNLASQIFGASGYRVVAVDPVASRREMAQRCGVREVFAKVPMDDSSIVDQVAIVVDCSGHEQAVIDALRTVRKGGELSLVGVPWKRRSDASAHQVLDLIFHRYVHVRSGWEWEVPRTTGEFTPFSLMRNYAAGMKWMVEGRIRVDSLGAVMSPADAQEAYLSLAEQRQEKLSVVFDWRKV